MTEFVSKLKNLEMRSTKQLSLDNLQLILAVLDFVFEKEEYYPKKGTFRLEWQDEGKRYGEKVLEFNFPKGVQKHFLAQEQSSDVMASNVLTDAATYPREYESAITFLPCRPLILRLNASEGRYLAAFFVDNGNFTSQEIVYTALAKTLAYINQDDKVLKEFYDHTLSVETDEMEGLLKVDRDIGEFLKNYKHS